MIAVAKEGKTEIEQVADEVIYIPTCMDEVSPGSGSHPASDLCILRSEGARLQHRQTEKPGEIRNGRVAQ